MTLLVLSLLAGIACLFVAESCSRFPGNSSFERNVEFTVLVHQYYGRVWYYLLIFFLYGSIQSQNIAGIIGCAQVSWIPITCLMKR